MASEGLSSARRDLLLALASGGADAEDLSDHERASIAVETPLIRALRMAAAADAVRHVAAVGRRGTGKTHAVRTAAALGFAAFDLSPTARGELPDVERRAAAAIRESKRVFLAVSYGDLERLGSRSDVPTPLAKLLERVEGALGAGVEWGEGPWTSLSVLDLDFMVAARPRVIHELLQVAGALALRGPRDRSRQAASVALRAGTLRAWATAIALDAERRQGPLTISDLWRFVAQIACGGRAATSEQSFDLAQTVAARLLAHGFTSERIRSAAEARASVAEWELAALAGFDGESDELTCSDPSCLAGQAALFLEEPPAAWSEPGDFDRVVHDVDADGDARVPRVLMEAVRSAGRGRGGSRPEGHGAVGASLSLAWPNPTMRRDLGPDCIPSLCVNVDGRTVTVSAREYRALLHGEAGGVSEDDTGTLGVTAGHPPLAAAKPAPMSASDEPSARPPVAHASARPIAVGTSLLDALEEQGMLAASVRQGGAFRCAAHADLAGAPRVTTIPEHVDRIGAADRSALGVSFDAFVAARAALVDACARMTEPVPSDRSLAFSASIAIESGAATGRDIDGLMRAYVEAYATMLGAARAVGGELLERAMMIDVAYCVAGGRRRARLMPLHPIVAERACGDRSGDVSMPAVIALCHRRVTALHEEGEPGFFHDEPERWPSIEEQRRAMSASIRAWGRARPPADDVTVDLVDVRWSAPLVDAAAQAFADLARDAGVPTGTVRIRSLATSAERAAVMVPPTSERAAPGTAAASLVCDPSIRAASETQPGALVFRVVPAPHAGRAAKDDIGGSMATVVYRRGLVALNVDDRRCRVEPSPVPPEAASALLAWGDETSGDGQGSTACRWRLSLAPDLIEAVAGGADPQAEVRAVAATPRRRPSRAAVREESSARTPAEAAPKKAPAETDEGEHRSPPATSHAEPSRHWAQAALRAEVARACGRGGYETDESMVADVVRDAVAARRAPLRHVVIREVSDCLRPVLVDSIAEEVITDAVEALVDLGDVVARRSDERGPYLLELASSAFVTFRDASRVLLLGRAEAALADEIRAGVRTIGRLREADPTHATEAIAQLRFRGASELTWSEWSRVPRYAGPEEALRAVSNLKRFEGRVEDYEAFDPTSSPAFYRGRHGRAKLDEVLTRDAWAVASREGDFEAKEYRLFRRNDGVTLSAPVDRSRFVELAAACAARAASGRRMLARLGGGVVRLHFPPPRWLARVLALGATADAGDALAAWSVLTDVEAEVRDALRSALWCEVVAG